MTDEELRTVYPEIPWSEPVEVTAPDGRGLACRLCIAQYGLKGSDVTRLHKTHEEFYLHMAQFHA